MRMAEAMFQFDGNAATGVNLHYDPSYFFTPLRLHKLILPIRERPCIAPHDCKRPSMPLCIMN